MITMPHVSLPDIHQLLWFLPVLLYTKAPRTWVPGEMVTSNMMNTLRDLFIEIEGGTAEMRKVTMKGMTSAELAGMPSTAGYAAIAYDKDQNQVVVSRNGSAWTIL